MVMMKVMMKEKIMDRIINMKHIKTYEAFINEGVNMEELQRELKVAKAKNPKAKVSYSFVKDGKKGYVIHIKESSAAVSEDIVNEDRFSDEISKYLDGMNRDLKAKNYKRLYADSKNLVDVLKHVVEGKDNDVPLEEGKNRFKYDYDGWQLVYHAYNQTTHKTIDKDPMAFIDWLAKNTQPPQI